MPNKEAYETLKEVSNNYKMIEEIEKCNNPMLLMAKKSTITRLLRSLQEQIHKLQQQTTK